jgi:hypothetical protein
LALKAVKSAVAVTAHASSATAKSDTRIMLGCGVVGKPSTRAQQKQCHAGESPES